MKNMIGNDYGRGSDISALHANLHSNQLMNGTYNRKRSLTEGAQDYAPTP